jgi:hypothetical protein
LILALARLVPLALVAVSLKPADSDAPLARAARAALGSFTVSTALCRPAEHVARDAIKAFPNHLARLLGWHIVVVRKPGHLSQNFGRHTGLLQADAAGARLACEADPPCR